MYLCSGAGGKVIIGCWHQESLKTGFQEFYTQNPQLCGPCKAEDFDFDSGDFKCGSSDYTSHWFTQEELQNILTESFPGDPRKQLSIQFKVLGVGIFAICDIFGISEETEVTDQCFAAGFQTHDSGDVANHDSFPG